MNGWKPATLAKNEPPAKTRNIHITTLAEYAMQMAITNGGLTSAEIINEVRRLIADDQIPFISLGGKPSIRIIYGEDEWQRKNKVTISAKIRWGWQLSDPARSSYQAEFDEKQISLANLPETLISALRKKAQDRLLLSSDLIEIEGMPAVPISGIDEKGKTFDIQANAWPSPRSWTAVFRKLKRIEKIKGE